MPTQKIKCKDCKWWDKSKKKLTLGVGSCKKHSPILIEGLLNLQNYKEFKDMLPKRPLHLFRAIWPQTAELMWCGEFEKK